MCLITFQTTPAVAETDIPVRKVVLIDVDGNVYSQYMSKRHTQEDGWDKPSVSPGDTRLQYYRYRYHRGVVHKTEFSTLTDPYGRELNSVRNFSGYDKSWTQDHCRCDHQHGDPYDMFQDLMLQGAIVVQQGFHSVIPDSIDPAHDEYGQLEKLLHDNRRVVAGIIPKGALYYEGAPGLVVSNQLLIL